MEERIKYTSLVASSSLGEFVAAGAFMFFGFTFLLILDPSVKIDVNGPSTKQPLIHHPYKFVFTANEEPSQEIILSGNVRAATRLNGDYATVCRGCDGDVEAIRRAAHFLDFSRFWQKEA